MSYIDKISVGGTVYDIQDSNAAPQTEVDELKSAVASLDNAVEQLESGSLSALGASEGQVPVADGEGEWAWGDAPGGGGTVTDVQIDGTSILDAQGVANITPSALDIKQTVSGTTPSITALSGIRYICGEVATLDITLPASGCFDVVFESGSTPTVLTATGVTWPSWFDATALEANTTYEISIADGYGAVMAWA